MTKEAPKQEQGEPVGWIDSKGNMICTKINESCKPLYTTPQGCDECGANGGYALYCLECTEKFFGTKEWVELTDYEIKGVLGLSESWVGEDCSIPDMIGFAKAIEDKLKDKNT